MIQRINPGVKIVCLPCVLSCVQLFVTLWIIAFRAPLSWEFFHKEYWSGIYFLLQGIILTQGLNPRLLYCRWILQCSGTREAWEHSFSKFSRRSHSVGRRLGRMQAQKSTRNPNNRWLVHFGLCSHLLTSSHGPGEIPMMPFYDGLASVLIKASRGLFNIRHRSVDLGFCA